METTANKVRILLIDDDEDDFIIFRTVLKKIPRNPYVLTWSSSYEDGRKQILENEYDVYIIDYQLGMKSGIDLLKEFDALRLRQPFIMLTGAADGRVEREALKTGAADYLVKGSFDEELLSRVLNYSLQRKSVEAERIQQLIDINRSKDEFIAVASHELRTPATAVKQYVAMIMDGYAGDITDTQLSFLKRAYDSNERQLQIIDDILRVARLDLDKVTLELKSFNITRLIEGIFKDFESLLKKRQQTATLTSWDESATLYADEMYLRMAIGNIIDNASKYSREQATISVDMTEGDNNTILIRISDEGVGIATEDIAKLFIKFSRIHNPLSIERGGTGLGLFWSREIVKMHGGEIEVDSTEGKGTTFTISLPLPR